MNPTAAAAAAAAVPSDGQSPAKQQKTDEHHNGVDDMPALSRDTLTHIFAYLSPTEVAGRCAGVASGWRAAADDAWLWGVFLGRQFGGGLAAAASSLSGEHAKFLFAQQFVTSHPPGMKMKKGKKGKRGSVVPWDWQQLTSEERWARAFKGKHLQISVFADGEPSSAPLLSKLIELTDAQSLGHLFGVPRPRGIDSASKLAYDVGLCLGDMVGQDEEGEICFSPDFRAVISIVDLRGDKPRVATLLAGSDFEELDEYGPRGFTVMGSNHTLNGLKPPIFYDGQLQIDFSLHLNVHVTAANGDEHAGGSHCKAEGSAPGLHVHCRIKGNLPHNYIPPNLSDCDISDPDDIEPEFFEIKFMSVDNVHEFIYASLPALGLQ